MIPVPTRDDAIRAMTEVADAAGFADACPVVMQDTNNVVAWLAPHEVVAKVGTFAHSAESLAHEVAVCAHLAALDSPVAAPLGPLRRSLTGHLPVSLWERLQPSAEAAPAGEVAAALRAVHTNLQDCPVALPSYLAAIEFTRITLFDDERMRSLPIDDLHLLRSALDEWTGQASSWPSAPAQPLHGEPHTGNVIVTASGPRLIDFESACEGPAEWDLASMPAEIAAAYGDVDADLLSLLRLLNSARVATWCWAAADHPTMRSHGIHHLELVRAGRL